MFKNFKEEQEISEGNIFIFQGVFKFKLPPIQIYYSSDCTSRCAWDLSLYQKCSGKGEAHRQRLYKYFIIVHRVFLTHLIWMMSHHSFSHQTSPRSHRWSHTLGCAQRTHCCCTQTYWADTRVRALRGKPQKHLMNQLQNCRRLCADRAGRPPGSVQLVKWMSSMATCPGLLKDLQASNSTVKSWGIRPTVTSAGCHESPWLPDSHHSAVVLEPSLRSTFSISPSVTMHRLKIAYGLFFRGGSSLVRLWRQLYDKTTGTLSLTWILRTYPLHSCCSGSAACRWRWPVSWGDCARQQDSHHLLV